MADALEQLSKSAAPSCGYAFDPEDQVFSWPELGLHVHMADNELFDVFSTTSGTTPYGTIAEIRPYLEAAVKRRASVCHVLSGVRDRTPWCVGWHAPTDAPCTVAGCHPVTRDFIGALVIENMHQNHLIPASAMPMVATALSANPTGHWRFDPVSESPFSFNM